MEDDDAVPARDRKQGAQRMARQPNFWSERQRRQSPFSLGFNQVNDARRGRRASVVQPLQLHH